MNKQETLKAKWTRIAETGETIPAFDLDEIGPGKFCVHISESGGVGPCSSSVMVTGFFDSPNDALACYRYSQIPYILDWDSGVRSENGYRKAEDYLQNYDDEFQSKIQKLLITLDEVLESQQISADTLESLKNLINDTFEKTHPEHEVCAWGSIGDVLCDPCFYDNIDEEIAESDEEEAYLLELKKLLDSKNFDETKEEHLSLAKEFFEAHQCA